MVGLNVQFSGYLSRLFLINIDLGCSTRVQYEKKDLEWVKYGTFKTLALKEKIVVTFMGAHKC